MSSEPRLNPNALFGFDGAFLRRLERLTLLNRTPLSGPSAGPRRSPRRGASVEFADFRDYAPGDDFRRIDWNAYARLDRLFLRLYSAEEMTTVTLFLDHSASMRFGEPSKGLTAARLAAIFSFVALHKYDRVAVAGWNDTMDHYVPPQSGKAVIPLVWNAIAGIMSAPGGGTDCTALRGHVAYRRGPGLAIVFSDLLSDTDWRAGLRALRSTGQEVSVVQILSPEELNPAIRGDWKLRDAEHGRTVEITVSPRLLRRYEEELAAHTNAIREFCRKEGIAYLQIPSDSSLGESVLTALHAARVMG